MKPVDVEKNVAFVDKVQDWRLHELKRLFPDMPSEKREEIACRHGDPYGDPYMIEVAIRLHDDGCPHELAYRILR